MQNIRYLKQIRVWTLLTLACLWGAGASPPAQADLFGISEKEEIQAGQEVKQEAYKQYGRPLPYNHPMSQRVRALGRRFADLSTRKNIPYTYEVLNNDKLLNAFAAPGGPVFVTTKLVKTTTNDAELAYVLGHETAHIERKHIVSAVEKQQKIGLGVGILGAILGRGSNGNIIQVFTNVAFTAYTRGYSRDQENEADIVGTRWMSRLGFDPNAAVSMLGRLGSGNGGGLDKYLATHPDPKDRQEKMRKLIASENLMDVARRAGGPRLTAADLPEYSYKQTAADLDNEDPAFNDRDFRNAERAEFDDPLLAVRNGNNRIILAPVGSFGRWARGEVTVDRRNEDVVTVRRGQNSIRLRRGSRQAVINGRTTTILTAPVISRGVMYAPLDALAEGVGADAGFSSDGRKIWITLDDRRFYADTP